MVNMLICLIYKQVNMYYLNKSWTLDNVKVFWEKTQDKEFEGHLLYM
ncbi:MAG: hypothetical protein K0Q49_1560 [Haloplasmataceae bacterium]|jgi:hypothetical protein|nr:hypothetical protein [Haloplasmataceae bacterium]